MTPHYNNWIERIFDGGNKISYRDVNSVDDVEIVSLDSSTLNGVFRHWEDVDNCEFVVAVQIGIIDGLETKVDATRMYHYKNHYVQGKSLMLPGGNLWSDVGNVPYDAVMAHERSHASHFLETVIPDFSQKVKQYSVKDKNKIKAILGEVIRKYLQQDADKTNRAQTDWFKQRGVKVNVHE